MTAGSKNEKNVRALAMKTSTVKKNNKISLKLQERIFTKAQVKMQFFRYSGVVWHWVDSLIYSTNHNNTKFLCLQCIWHLTHLL